MAPPATGDADAPGETEGQADAPGEADALADADTSLLGDVTMSEA